MMTACQKIKREILLQAAARWRGADDLNHEEAEFMALVEAGVTEQTVDACYEALRETGAEQDFEEEFRCGPFETKLPCGYSRYYAMKSVARKLSDGSYVGWTYFYGGGKYGEPEAIDWMDDAYDLEVTERMAVVLEFKRVEP